MNVCTERPSDPAGHRRDLKITRAQASRAGEEGVFCVCGTLGLAPLCPTHVPPGGTGPRQPELSRDKPRALLVCLFAGGFQSLSQNHVSSLLSTSSGFSFHLGRSLNHIPFHGPQGPECGLHPALPLPAFFLGIPTLVRQAHSCLRASAPAACSLCIAL